MNLDFWTVRFILRRWLQNAFKCTGDESQLSWSTGKKAIYFCDLYWKDISLATKTLDVNVLEKYAFFP